MIPARVSYQRPSSLDEALEALREPEARALAGGQSLVPAMKLRLARPALLVDLAELGLRGISTHDGTLRIGACTTWDDLILADELSVPGLAAVRECASGIGDLQVRNLGTIGGSLAHADPASDVPAVALALGLHVRVISSSGERTLAVDELLLGPFTTALEPGELITEVLVPVPPEGSGSAYVAVEHPASGFALAGAAALVTPDGGSSVALTGVASTAFRPPEDLAEVELTGDRYAPAEYRRELAAIVTTRALDRARARAKDGSA